jgi:hypothetical protein
MSLRLARRRSIWFPTLPGLACAIVAFGSCFGLWWFHAESFLSRSERLPAEILVVEGWIGSEGVRSAGEEFARGGYRFIITTSGLASDRWRKERWTYADTAWHELTAMGIPRDRIISAPPEETEGQRTFQSAVAVWRALDARGIHPDAVNLFTMAAHARRSRLIYSKVFEPRIKVGIIAWTPPDYRVASWWQSSDRAQEVIKETAGYAFELLFNSGRRSNSPVGNAP